MAHFTPNFGGQPSQMNSPLPPQSNDLPTGLIDIMKKTYTPLAHRDNEFHQLLISLGTHQTPNALLIGEPGVGKTALVQELVRRMVGNDPLVHATIGTKKIYELNYAQLVAGASYVGQMEARVQDVITFAKTEPVILFMDEFHQFNTQTKVAPSVLDIMKTSLSDGSICIIGATTEKESIDVLKDKAIERRFKRIGVSELPKHIIAQEFDTIVESLCNQSINKHKQLITIPDDVKEQLIDTSEKLTLKRPASILQLLDYAISIARIEMEHYYQTFDLQTQQLLRNNANNQLTIKTKHVTDAYAKLQTTYTSLTKNRVQEAVAALQQTIVGQDPVVTQLETELIKFDAQLFERTKPLSFLFAGETGTGKTETAKTIAKHFFGEKNFLYINMTEYTEDSAVATILGSPNGYIGSDASTPLALDDLVTNPKQVVLLDEFEKAHPLVQRLFMQALDEGFLLTKRNVRIPFHDAIVIATTNAGQHMKTTSIGFGTQQTPTTQETKQTLINQLKQDMPIELINRFEHIVPYTSISRKHYVRILKQHYNQMVQDIHKRKPTLHITPTQLDLDDAVTYAFIEAACDASYTKELNARPAHTYMRHLIEETCIQALVNNQSDVVFDV